MRGPEKNGDTCETRSEKRPLPSVVDQPWRSVQVCSFEHSCRMARVMKVLTSPAVANSNCHARLRLCAQRNDYYYASVADGAIALSNWLDVRGSSPRVLGPTRLLPLAAVSSSRIGKSNWVQSSKEQNFCLSQHPLPPGHVPPLSLVQVWPRSQANASLSSLVALNEGATSSTMSLE